MGLELQGGDTVRVAGHDVNGHEPGLQGQVAAVHDRACGHRSLLPAGRTFPARPATLQSPAPGMAEAGQTKPSGQRLAARCRARRLHRESAPRRRRGTSGGRISSGWATEHQANILPTATANPTCRQTGFRGISL